jgi:N-acetyltransferase 10
LGLSVLEAANNGVKHLSPETSTTITPTELSFLLSPFDVKRLESYAQNTLDYHVVLDLLPTIAALFFERKLGADLHLTAIQSSILLGIGLQRKSVEDVEAELQLPVSQTLALFVKLIRKITARLQDVRKAAISETLPVPEESGLGITPEGAEKVVESLDLELEEAGNEEKRAMREKQRAMIDALDLSK